MRIKDQIPNLLTLANMACGVFGIIQLLEIDGFTFGKYEGLEWGIYMVVLGGVFDFLDGFVARLLKSQSKVGAELDSLADVVTFGLLPGVLLYVILRDNGDDPWRFLALIVPLLSAYRLAKFNIDTRQSDSFFGLPTPANAIFICSLIYLFKEPSPLEVLSVDTQKILWRILPVASSLLLISELPLLAFKFKSFKFKDNKTKYIFLAVSLISVIILQWLALPFIIIAYLFVSLYHAWGPASGTDS